MKYLKYFLALNLLYTGSLFCLGQGSDLAKRRFTVSSDIPAGPTGISGKGGDALPKMTGNPTMDVPAISAISEITFPDETLVITGDGLSDSKLVVWAEGLLFYVEPLRAANNRMQAVVPASVTSSGVTKKVPKSTMLVWPVTGDKTGVPIRVNAPASWWIWPRKVFTGPEPVTIKLFGKNLIMENERPVMVIQYEKGKPQLIEIVDSNPYCLEGKLPDGLPLGNYRVWAHNGTGGNYGWSDALLFEIERGNENPTKVFLVDDYRKESKNDTESVKKAIDDAVKNGSGIIQFSKGAYSISNIVLPKDIPIILRGSGIGSFDWKTNSFDTKSGTMISDMRRDNGKFMIEAYGSGLVIQDMTISINGISRVAGVKLAGQNQIVQRVRLLHNVPYVYSSSNITCSFEGVANHQILNSEFFLNAKGINIERGNLGTDYVRIENNKFYGYYNMGRAVENQAVDNFGGCNIILANNYFEGLDPEHARILNRTYVMHHQSVSNCYVANNTSIKVGSHESIPGLDRNTGEQYLSHPNEGVFAKTLQVKSSGNDYIKISKISELTSNKPKDHLTGEKGHWIVYIAKGRGVGQWRVVSEVVNEEIKLARPWRILPDASSTVIITRVNRQNVFYNNFVDAAMSHNPKYVPKTSGIYIYHNAIDNIVAKNDLRNLGNGIAVFTTSVTPSAWNVIRENKISNIKGKSLGTSPHPMFYTENLGSPEPIEHWAMVGNVCRNNTGIEADVSAMIGFKYNYLFDNKYNSGSENGIVMSVIENNHFEGTDRGIILSSPSNWSLIRNNTIQLKNPKANNIEFVSKKVLAPLIISKE